MFVIDREPYIRDNPWDFPFEDRLKRLMDYRRLGQKTVVYLYELADTSTFRYRVYNMCQALESGGEWKGTYFFAKDLERLSGYMGLIDNIIVARFRWTLPLENFLAEAKRQGIHIGFDVDDMVYTTKYISLITNTLSVCMNEDRYDYWFSYTARLEATLRLCDYAVTTNKYLSDFLERDTAKKCYIAPNFYNRIQAAVSDKYYRQKEIQKSSGKFIIGYFSGTPSHINDFLLAAPELLELLDNYDDMVLRIVGFMELPPEIRLYVDRGRIERIPLQNFIELQALMAEVDVSIVPLVNNEFSNCKSELKFYEAGIVGTVTCATPSYTFQNAIKHGENGFLCETGQWYDTVKMIYEMKDSKREDIARKANLSSKRQYAYYNQTEALETMMNEIMEDRKK